MIDAATRIAIDATLKKNDLAGAANAAAQALRSGQRDALLYRLVARQQEENGDYAGAHALLAEALKLAPQDADLYTDIGAVWRKSGDAGEALKIFDSLIGQGVDHAPTWLERGHALLTRGEYRLANADYRRAAMIESDNAEALAAVAETAIQMGDRIAAGGFADRALAVDPRNVVAVSCRAQLEIDDGLFADAQRRLEKRLAERSLSDIDHLLILGKLGDALDGAGKIPQAFRAYSKAKSIFRRVYRPRYGDEARGQRALIQHVHAGLARAPVENWPALPSSGALPEADNHLFLIGYPRSGTTLLENMLAGLPAVEALEEKPTLAATEPAFLANPDGIAQLSLIDEAKADHFRRLYWHNVASFGAQIGGKTLLDMDPLKGVYLPVIARLFPQARIIVMRRDPRDVVWSCFRRNFQPTPAAYEFSSLEGAARHYDALMRLTQESLDRLPLQSTIVRYDDLVADFGGVTRRLCDFARLDWSPEVGNFAQTADRRGVSTASARQVRRGLFDGTNQWRRYSKEMRSVLPILQPWVSRFGFGD